MADLDPQAGPAPEPAQATAETRKVASTANEILMQFEHGTRGWYARVSDRTMDRWCERLGTPKRVPGPGPAWTERRAGGG
jgi:hypothetical protein